jgi:formimidoylglutamate deiminase
VQRVNRGILEILQADLTCLDGRFVADVRIAVNANGRIAAVGMDAGAPQPVTRRLTGRALLPGFVNVHSHAFQRALRGCGEFYPAGMGDFWSWREAMYAFVQRIKAHEFKRICRQAFEEMLACGTTTVGEFHYLHHDDAAAFDYAFDPLVLEAADEAGIRLVLLCCYYRTGGVGDPLQTGQLRFDGRSVDTFLKHVDGLAAQLDRSRQTIGLAPHSIRAVPTADLKLLHQAALDRGWVVHMHVEEQAREIRECRKALGTSPLQWLLDNLDLGPHFTAVHMTQSDETPADRYVRRGANVCSCPITEGNLGDGIGPIGELLSRRPDSVCVGSDSNIRLDMAEELRWLEFAQRLRRQKRGVCVGSEMSVGRQLLRCGTVNGARALGIDTGRIEAGRPADFCTLDLAHPALTGCTAETLLDGFLLGAGGDAVREVCVGGRWKSVR